MSVTAAAGKPRSEPQRLRAEDARLEELLGVLEERTPLQDYPHARAVTEQVLVGPEHPCVTRGLPMDFPGVGFGVNDLFAFQARAMLEQVAGIDGLPRCAPPADGLRNLRIIARVAESAAAGGATQSID